MNTFLNRAILLLFCCVFYAVGWVACGKPVKPTTLPLTYTPVSASFTNSGGWKIELTKATLSFEYIRLYEKDESVALGHVLRQTLASLKPWREAWAHPGHSGLGDVLAEMRFAKTLNLLKPETNDLGIMSGFTGVYEAGELTFRDTDTVTLEGNATKGSERRSFAFELTLQKQDVKGIHGAHKVTGTTPVSLQIRVSQWFELIDFNTFKGNGTSGTILPDSASKNILRKAVFSTNNYNFKWGPSLP